MARKVLIFLHSADDTPGYVEAYLRQRGINYQLIHGYKNEAIPMLDDSMAGLIFMGGSMSANDDIVWIKKEIILIEQALQVGIPIIGHCLGGQLISKALGQTVSKHPVAEVGWHPCFRVEPEPDSKIDPKTDADWLEGIEDPFMMFHWHYESFDIPPEAKPLFSSEHCKNQAFSYANNVLAMQCHVEMTEELLNHWTDKFQDELLQQTNSEQTHQQIKQQLKENVGALNRVADQLYGRWVKTLTL